MAVKPLMLLPPAIFAVLAVTFYVGMQREDPDQLPSAIAGQPAPEVAVTPLGDLPVFEGAMLKDGEVKLVNFWASWCAPCRVEHPNLDALAQEGITIYGVNYKDQPAKALGFLEELGNPYAAVGQDAAGRMGLNWGLYGVPETYVIDGEGRVVTRFAGPVTQRVIASTIRPAIEQARGN
ncbi:DsbE family thiol:disulfide interchange protein [Oceanicola sp. 22II-s10i]|uniref:DsbE family thiol:disulfide interchange protein n=1 Tax=Oceanicola sp. 22II-s10i TaxID=1317116 RepID=UPI000B523CB7|nr:DsbE family thiol:disulfide interchange protein [Oceanicola sp. 22II-s10i]